MFKNKLEIKSKKPWPTSAVMNQIYDLNLWGTYGLEFYSGNGSHDRDIVDPYLKTIITFLSSFNPKLSICDLGCGDFNIGSNLVEWSEEYFAVDIVDKLITFNKKMFINKGLSFHCLDISKDILPSADCVILRQVLQHLNNNEIQNILKNISATGYKYLLLTEHIPKGEFIPNKDIISGQGIRLKHNSGVCITSQPFNFKIKHKSELLITNLKKNKGVLVTYLFTL
ncbi:methyltransferase domain-containing protein [Ichthyenterobacterium sp. W332]|uniref:Methyltransferase domain-containing protein n=1 Tax=Microcosmobacter mediterraneus TaxID=3075607 RepID=A0ABU2YLE9_9FLAO|nr:methyltransferase domain-containing protein [Ichthyenterobacterium sp. W332]MDT0558980.1 methyltransferase domain-containing protein [Ichthyenterobacterium sp. W332]